MPGSVAMINVSASLSSANFRIELVVAQHAPQAQEADDLLAGFAVEDPFADFESYPYYISATPIPWNPGAGDFVRSGLRRGLELEQRFGSNPYRFGLIGSTDSHTGLATA